jgi:hypothetical protein
MTAYDDPEYRKFVEDLSRLTQEGKLLWRATEGGSFWTSLSRGGTLRLTVGEEEDIMLPGNCFRLTSSDSQDRDILDTGWLTDVAMESLSAVIRKQVVETEAKRLRASIAKTRELIGIN